MTKPREFWISQSKTWSDETKSYSIEKTSVDRITEESVMRLVMDITVGIHVIEYSELKALKAKLTIATEALELIAATNLVGINLEEYFFGLSKDELAECVCHDTATAREALTKIEGEL